MTTTYVDFKNKEVVDGGGMFNLMDKLDNDLYFQNLTTGSITHDTNPGTVSSIDGSIGASGTFSYTEVDVSIYDKISFQPFAFTSSNFGYAFFEDGYVLINAVKTEDSEYLTLDVPSNAKYFRVCWFEAVNSLDLQGITIDYERLIDRVGSTPSNSIIGKEFYSLSDSLGTAGKWQSKLAELTGATFDNDKNITQNISAGGTPTRGTLDSCGQWRARNVSALNPDVLFIENINDVGYMEGTIDDAPFMLSDIIMYPTTFSSSADAINYWNANFLSIVQSYSGNQAKGVAINLPYHDDGFNVKINNVATSDGTFTLKIGSLTYGIAVTTSDTISDIIDKILEYSYQIYPDTANDDGVSVDFANLSTAPQFNDIDSTGVTVTITATSTAKNLKGFIFVGEDTTPEWENSSNWGTTGILGQYSYYKGLLEYLIANNPTCKIIWWMPSVYSLSSSDYLKTDGTFDIDAYKVSSEYTTYKALKSLVKNVCELYKVKYFDVDDNCNISPYNVFTYYEENNVHPKDLGYEKWGETLAELL